MASPLSAFFSEFLPSDFQQTAYCTVKLQAELVVQRAFEMDVGPASSTASPHMQRPSSARFLCRITAQSLLVWHFACHRFAYADPFTCMYHALPLPACSRYVAINSWLRDRPPAGLLVLLSAD